MGKKNEPDVKAIIREAVEAGRLAGMSTARDAYKATERRLYAYRALKQKIIDDTERLEQLKMRGTPEHDKSIVRYSRSGYRMSPEEMLEAVIRDTEAAISSDQYEIDTLDKALKHIEDDPWYGAITGKYIYGYDDEDLARDFDCGLTQLWKQRGRLVRALAVLLYGSQASV